MKVTTEDGTTGIGDATLNGREMAVVSCLEQHIAPCLIGKDAQNIEDIWQYLYKGVYWRKGPVNMAAIAGIDMALWDIAAKLADEPLSIEIRRDVAEHGSARQPGALAERHHETRLEGELRLQLDALKQEKNKTAFLDLLTKKADWSALSRHLKGDEVDLAASTEPHIVAALATCLNHSQGRNSEGTRVHHFDNTKLAWPIIDSTRAKWPDRPA